MNKIKNLVIKASAGTGKTYRLSLEYIIALCKKGDIEPIDYKNILVMTFTRKATAEIKEGILNKLSEFMEIYEISKNSELSVVEAISKSKLIDDKKRNNYLNLIESIKNIEPNLVIDNNFLENLLKINTITIIIANIGRRILSLLSLSFFIKNILLVKTNIIPF